MKMIILLAVMTFAANYLPADKTLFKLESNEYIVSSESQLFMGMPGSSGFSIVTKLSNKFFVHTEKGKVGPFDKLPAEYLPANGLRTSDVYEFKDPGDKGGKTEMGMTATGAMTIKLDNKVIATLPPGEVPATLAVDKKKNRIAYITMTEGNDGNLTYNATQMPSGKKIQIKGAMMVTIKKNESSGNFVYEALLQDGTKAFYNESGNKQGPFSNNARAFELTENNQIVIMEPGKDGQSVGIFKDGKMIHTIKKNNSDMNVLFNGDAAKYCLVSAGGLDFSDGKKVSNGLMPTIEKSASGPLLHYLRINDNKEVIQSSIPW